MPSYYDTEVEKQKKSKLDTILPILAAIEAVGTSISSKGRNVTGNTLDLWKGVQGQREAALERALGRDKAAADAARDAKLLGFQEAEEGRRKLAAGREEAEFQAKEDAVHRAMVDKDRLRSLLNGTPDVTDDATNTVTLGRKPMDPEEAAKEIDPLGWLTNKLKPQGVSILPGMDAFYTIPKTGGPATKVTTAEGGTPTPKPSSGGEAKAPTGYRWSASGTLEAIPGGPADPKTKGDKALSGDAAKLSGYVTTLETQGTALRHLIKDKGIRWVTAEYKKSNPAVVNVIEDVADAKGRLRSGGAVNDQESDRFKAPFTGLGNIFYANDDAALAAIDQVLAEASTVRKGMGVKAPDSTSTSPAPAAPGSDPKKALAQQALNDPEATEEEKAAARRILGIR